MSRSPVITGKNIFFKSFVYIAMLIQLGCVGFSITGGPGKIVEPHLKSLPVDGERLVVINSVLILPVMTHDRSHKLQDRFWYLENLQEAFGGEAGLEVVGSRRSLDNFVWPANSSLVDNAELAQLGRKHSADAVLITHVDTYRNRDGSQVGVETPAKVSFRMELLNVQSASPVWTASYYYADQALSDNIFRVDDRFAKGRNAGWRTADDLMRGGIIEAATALAKARDRQFSN